MKKISIFTGTRAEYGLLNNLINLFDYESKVKFKLIVSGTHLVKDFGETIKEIKRTYSGEIIKVHLPIEENFSISTLTGIAISKFSEILEINRFDLLIVLGDRYECFAITVAAFLLNIPINSIGS